MQHHPFCRIRQVFKIEKGFWGVLLEKPSQKHDRVMPIILFIAVLLGTMVPLPQGSKSTLSDDYAFDLVLHQEPQQPHYGPKIMPSIQTYAQESRFRGRHAAFRMAVPIM
jgi:hypothetical protein